MGWLRYFFMGEIERQLELANHETQIEDLKQQLHARQTTSASVEIRLQMLQQENDELKLYLAALLRLLISKGVASLEEIRALVNQVDREDGSADQRYGGPMLP